MNRVDVFRSLETLIIDRLFRRREWLVDREIAVALGGKLFEMGLQERVPGDAATTRCTSLGKELNLHLLMVFMGLWDQYEIPGVLAENGLIDEWECSRLEERLYAGADPELTLRGRVQQLYSKYYSPGGLLN